MADGEAHGLRGLWRELITRHPREVCELCGAPIIAPVERYGLVPDPSARYPLKPEWNGQRFVVACSVEHMTELYRRGEQAAAEHRRGRE